MKNLEDIPKKNVFEVPEGYFDRLPGVIQSRISEPRSSPTWIPAWSKALRYALPTMLLMAAVIFWYQNNSGSFSSKVNVQSELASIRSDQLAAYLGDHELTTEDLVETVTWSSDDLGDLENAVYSTLDVSHRQLEEILDEYDEL
jgi:hypothetical protein